MTPDQRIGERIADAIEKQNEILEQTRVEQKKTRLQFERLAKAVESTNIRLEWKQ